MGVAVEAITIKARIDWGGDSRVGKHWSDSTSGVGDSSLRVVEDTVVSTVVHGVVASVRGVQQHLRVSLSLSLALGNQVMGVAVEAITIKARIDWGGDSRVGKHWSDSTSGVGDSSLRVVEDTVVSTVIHGVVTSVRGVQ